MDIRPARTGQEISDAAQLMRALVNSNAELYNDDLGPIEDYYRDAWFRMDDCTVPVEYAPPNGEVLVAHIGPRLAGTAATYRMDDYYCELRSLYVMPEQRQKGLAMALCHRIIDLARAQGYSAIRLSVGQRQTEAMHLYRRLGFTHVAPWDANPPHGYDYLEYELV